jgi:hypothetical protein
MPDIGASRKPEIVDRLIRDGLAVLFPVSGPICVLFGQQLSETST